MIDDQTVARLIEGDQESMEVLVSRYYLPAVRAAYLILQDKGLAEDVVQNAFLCLRHSIRHYDSKRPFGPWFLRGVVNAAINANHRESRLVSLDQMENDNFSAESWLHELAPGPAEQAEDAEKREAISKALARLNPRQRAAVVLRYYLEMSENEMVEELNSSKSSLKWWLYTARMRLRDLLKAYEPAGSRDNGKEKHR